MSSHAVIIISCIAVLIAWKFRWTVKKSEAARAKRRLCDSSGGQWIAVSEKKPEIGVNVITGRLVDGVITKEYVNQWYKCLEYGSESWLYDEDYCECCECFDKPPTHWCKIPEFKND